MGHRLKRKMNASYLNPQMRRSIAKNARESEIRKKLRQIINRIERKGGE